MIIIVIVIIIINKTGNPFTPVELGRRRDSSARFMIACAKSAERQDLGDVHKWLNE